MNDYKGHKQAMKAIIAQVSDLPMVFETLNDMDKVAALYALKGMAHGISVICDTMIAELMETRREQKDGKEEIR